MQADSGDTIAIYAGHVAFTKEDLTEIKSLLLANQGLRLFIALHEVTVPSQDTGLEPKKSFF